MGIIRLTIPIFAKTLYVCRLGGHQQHSDKNAEGSRVWVQMRTEEQTAVKHVGSWKREDSVLLTNAKLFKRQHRTARKELESFRSAGERAQVGAGRRGYGTCTLAYCSCTAQSMNPLKMCAWLKRCRAFASFVLAVAAVHGQESGQWADSGGLR